MTTQAITRLDAWKNTVTGIGGPGDKSSGFIFTPLLISNDPTTLEFLYEEDHVAGKIVDAQPDDVFRRGWSVTTSDDDDLAESIIDECDRLELEHHVDQALRWEGLYGGAAIFVGAEDGRSVTAPLDVSSVRRVHYLNTYDRWELTPYRYYEDALSPKFGRPEIYRVHPRSSAVIAQVGMLVHETRLVIFGGRPTTKTQLVANQYWGVSRLVRAFDAVKKYGGALASTLALLADSNQGVYKIKGLMEIIRGGKGELLQARMRAIDEVRSVINALILDADGESYERVATPLTEVANIVDRFKLDVAAAAEIPVTKLFGQAPAGLNATGESDLRNWYDRVEQEQRRRVKPALERIIRLILRSKDGPTRGVEPEKWSVKFPKPWTPTAKEQSEIYQTQANADAIYVDLGVLTPAQIARARFSGSESTEITLTPDELNALDSAANSMSSGASPDGPEQPLDGDPLGQPATQVTDDEDATGEPLSLIDARALASKMTAASVARCEHDKVNRCQLCGIERGRDFTTGPDGKPIWRVIWRAIGDTAEPHVDAEFDESKHERDERGRFSSTGGSGSSSESPDAKRKREQRERAQKHFEDRGKAAQDVAAKGGHGEAIDRFLNVERARASRDEREGRPNEASDRMNVFLREAQAAGATYDGPVFRGTSEAELQQILSGGKNQTTWSVSKDIEGAASFAKKSGVLLVIGRGSGAVPTDHLENSNTFNECLVPRGSRWKVSRERTVKGVRVVHLDPA